ncbi:MAG TPA: protein translocase subunit SecF [Longimicrobiales bacterium]|nr:protein translocase subunit SecF [Longimicrobiales bacterium]
MRRLFANANYQFIPNRRKAYIASAAAILISIAAAVFWQVNDGSWLNYGVDFTGGSSIRIAVEGESVDVTQVRQVATSSVPGATVTRFGQDNEFLIRTPGTGSDVATESSRALLGGLAGHFGEENIRLVSEESVGAKVGGELQTRALLAIIISFVATLIYIAFRFEWRFGVAAVIATLHDVVLTLGLIALLRLEISLTTVAAVLTILGYSLNDTIVIFDRIRENLHASKRVDFNAVLNRSINDTLPRTILTTGTTIATLLALYLFGGVIIRDFALILIAGILLGTYSSIFIASPALLEIEKRYPHQPKQPKRTRAPAAKPSRV